jgi:branched-chain amino acid aminotransferase
VLTHTLHYGMGVFEGVRAYKADQGTAIFRLPDHTRRLFGSAHIMKMPVPWSMEEINEAHTTVVRENGLETAYIRPLLFYGAEGMGLRADNLKVHAMVAAWEWGAYLGAENMKNGIRIKTSSYTRHHVNISMCKAKATGHYINSMLALNEALASGYDEAMLLDVDGYVAEGSGIVDVEFMVQWGVLLWSNEHAELLRYTDNLNLLAAISRAGLMTGEEVAALTAAYCDIRPDQSPRLAGRISGG